MSNKEKSIKLQTAILAAYGILKNKNVSDAEVKLILEKENETTSWKCKDADTFLKQVDTFNIKNMQIKYKMDKNDYTCQLY